MGSSISLKIARKSDIRFYYIYMMNARLVLLFIFFLFICQFSFGQKKDKWITINGTVVDTLGHRIANEQVALIDQKGNDKKMVVSDHEGKFSFKLKKKDINKLYVKCYSAYVNFDKIKLIDFLNNKKLVLNIDYINGVHVWRTGGCVIIHRHLDKVPFNYETAEMLRSYFGMVK